MSSKYKFVDGEAIYFVTSTVVGWAEVFTRTIYREILLDSFRFCQQNQGLQIHAWVLMPALAGWYFSLPNLSGGFQEKSTEKPKMAIAK